MPFKERLGDRRSDLRFEIIGQLWGALEAVEQLPMRNLGRGGALVEARLPLPVQSVHGVRLMFADQATNVQAVVRHVTPIDDQSSERYLIGLEFVEPGAVALEQIDRIVAAVLGPTQPAAEA
jgi:hypothetical protein